MRTQPARAKRIAAPSASSPARPGTARATCDATDRALIALLLRDVRATNRALARATGVSEWAVAGRLRHLREANILAASLVVDWRLVGYQVSAFALIRTERTKTTGVAERLTQRPDLQSLSRTLGAADLIAHVLGRDLAGLRQIADDIGALAGVASVELLPIVEFHRYVFERTPLPVPRWNPDDYAETALPLDALDRGLMRCLIEDGHQSNREIARRLAVSENTIRARLRRLEDSGMVRVIVMVDPYALGEPGIAYFALRTAGGSRARLARRLAARAEIAGLTSCLGTYDLMGVAVADSPQGLTRLLEDLHAQPGVDSLLQFPIVGLPMHRFHLARLLPP